MGLIVSFGFCSYPPCICRPGEGSMLAEAFLPGSQGGDREGAAGLWPRTDFLSRNGHSESGVAAAIPTGTREPERTGNPTTERFLSSVPRVYCTQKPRSGLGFPSHYPGRNEAQGAGQSHLQGSSSSGATAGDVGAHHVLRRTHAAWETLQKGLHLVHNNVHAGIPAVGLDDKCHARRGCVLEATHGKGHLKVFAGSGAHASGFPSHPPPPRQQRGAQSRAREANWAPPPPARAAGARRNICQPIHFY